MPAWAKDVLEDSFLTAGVAHVRTHRKLFGMPDLHAAPVDAGLPIQARQAPPYTQAKRSKAVLRSVTKKIEYQVVTIT